MAKQEKVYFCLNTKLQLKLTYVLHVHVLCKFSFNFYFPYKSILKSNLQLIQAVSTSYIHIAYDSKEPVSDRKKCHS